MFFGGCYYGHTTIGPREDFHAAHAERVEIERRRAELQRAHRTLRTAHRPLGTQRRAQLHMRAMAIGRS